MDNNKSHYVITQATPNDHSHLQAYRDLNKAIDDMDRKVQHVIKKHEAEFLYAYRNHILKIKKELAQIKHKSQQQEKMFSSNDRIQYLQKQMIIFREQALKLYGKLDQKTQQNQYYKSRIKELEKQHHNITTQEKEHLKISKMEEMNKSILANKIQELQEVINTKDELIAKLEAKIQILKQQTHAGSSLLDKNSQKPRIASFASTMRNGGESQRYSRNKQIMIHDTQMKEWFLQCIKAVKREVSMRNNSHHLMDLTHITSIEEFKTVDKLKLLELFLQNEKLLSWMYERIFPDRLSKLRSSLTSYYEPPLTQRRQEAKQVSEKVLPRVRLSKVDRNSGVMKDGKLNISMM